MKILTLGNEFISQDSLAKKIGEKLKKDFEIINIKDSFQLMTELNKAQDCIILDVVKDLFEARVIKVEELKNDSIISAHDFDAGIVIKLIGKDVKIIGIPMSGDEEEIEKGVKSLLNSN